MKFVLIKAGQKAEVVELKDRDTIDYLTMKKYLEIDSPVTVVERKVGNEYYDLWLDDEGLLKPEETRIITGFLNGGEELLVGNLLILKHDKEGNSVGLTEEDIENVFKPYHMISMDEFREYEGKDTNEDQVFRGYFDNGTCTIKAHSNWLLYNL